MLLTNDYVSIVYLSQTEPFHIKENSGMMCITRNKYKKCKKEEKSNLVFKKICNKFRVKWSNYNYQCFP